MTAVFWRHVRACCRLFHQGEKHSWSKVTDEG